MKSMIFIAAILMGTLVSAAEVDHRQRDQQARISQGVRSGSLTRGEAARLRVREARLRREIHHDRAVNGGYLTPGQKALVNRQENRLSRQIYRDKHNARVR